MADMFETMMLQGKPIVRVPSLTPMYLINDPDCAKRIIQQPEDVYIKGGKYFDRLAIPFGQGLVTSEGKLWQQQRELIQPFFHAKYLEQYAKIGIKLTNQLMDTVWNDHANKQTVFNISDEMMRLVLKISAGSLFNTDFGEDTKKIIHCVEFGQKFILGYYLAPPTIPSIPRWQYRRLDRYFKKVLADIVETRRVSTNKPDDILTALVTTLDPETQQPLPLELIFAQIVTLLVTGHETTGALLSWLWYELGLQPHISEKIREEINHELQGEPPSLKNISKLKYLRMVIDEALRLYPTIWTIHRYSMKEDNLAGYKIPKNSIVVVNPYNFQHDPTIWQEPLKFDPERFNKTVICPRHKMAYFPFGGGHRICIGKNFALQQIMLILTTIFQRFDVHSLQKEKPQQLPLVSLKQLHGINATITHTKRL